MPLKRHSYLLITRFLRDVLNSYVYMVVTWWLLVTVYVLVTWSLRDPPDSFGVYVPFTWWWFNLTIYMFITSRLHAAYATWLLVIYMMHTRCAKFLRLHGGYMVVTSRFTCWLRDHYAIRRARSVSTCHLRGGDATWIFTCPLRQAYMSRTCNLRDVVRVIYMMLTRCADFLYTLVAILRDLYPRHRHRVLHAAYIMVTAPVRAAYTTITHFMYTWRIHGGI